MSYIGLSARNDVRITTIGSANLDGSVIVNESSADKDFRVESDGNTHMLFVNGGNNCVGIGNASPTYALDIKAGTNTHPLRIGLTSDAYGYLTFQNSSGDVGYIGLGAGAAVGNGNANTFAIRGQQELRFATGGNNEALLLDTSQNATFANNIGVGVTPTHQLHVLTTDDKGFLLDRNTTNNPASLNEFSSYYSLSIKNRNSGSYLNFGGDSSLTTIQATDGAGSATAKNIALQPYGGSLFIGKTASDYDGGVFEASSGGTYVSRSGTPFGVNRNGSFNQLINFYKDGGDVGQIRIEETGFCIDGEGSHAGLKMFGSAIGPRQNGADAGDVIDLGWSSGKFKDLYLSGAVNAANVVASGAASVFNSGATNVVASFTSTDTNGAIQLADNGGNVELTAAGNTLQVNPAGGTSAFTVAANANVGIGNTLPLTGHSALSDLFIGGLGHIYGDTAVGVGGSFNFSQNSYVAGSDGQWKYITTDEASNYNQWAGTHLWRVAASGTGGTNITWNEAMKLDNSGTLMVGKTSSNGATAGFEARPDGIVYATLSSGSSYYLHDTSSNKFYVNANGGIYNYQSNDSNLSDEREKKNIATLGSKWDAVKKWSLKEFHYNADADSDSKKVGVIAQDLESDHPELVTEFDLTDTDKRKAVKEQQMNWMAIKALQEAMARIETLEARIAKLEE